MTPRLQSIRITDFRSIRGEITVPLGAPVVLIHGPNGVGKTSILSALELALTGDLPAMRRVEPSFLDHLTHRDADRAQIVLKVEGLSADGSGAIVDMQLADAELKTAPLLEGADRRLFSERCYLPQATLGRLLEIYQDSSPREDSPLTRFVKDLLGLDRLDALVNGLYAATDVRRTRRLVPEYKDVEEIKRDLKKECDALSREAAAGQTELSLLRERVATAIATLAERSGRRPAIDDDSSVAAFLEDEEEERRLVTLAGHRRELAAIRTQWQPLASGAYASERTALEVAARDASRRVETWRQGPGVSIEALLDDLRAVFPDLPSAISSNPELALARAHELVEGDLARCDALLNQDDAARARLLELDQAAERAKARAALIDEQMRALAGDTEGLSRSLAAIVPHLHTEECPVCGRDFREVSREPLLSHVSAKIAQLTQRAGRLQALVAEKTTAMGALVGIERDRAATRTGMLGQDARVTLKLRASRLNDARRNLAALAPAAAEGMSAIQEDAVARKRLAELRTRDQQVIDIRRGIIQLCLALAREPLGESEGVEAAAQRLQTFIAEEEKQSVEFQSIRRNALTAFQRSRGIREQLRAAQARANAHAADLERTEEVFDMADRRRLTAKALSEAASSARASIVRRVFNKSLNAIWRDLFVRLAPNEPFVPAFKLPSEGHGAIIASLETIHREGGRGGAPAAMLSAGNLNTAALTLFMALHLSVRSRLPWLVFDDPVQSMDEVHIQQFAALLRTLSKGHGKQVIIAVHDRALFDYLELELSPAFPEDQLITVELGRSGGITVAEPRFIGWAPDPAVAATA